MTESLKYCKYKLSARLSTVCCGLSDSTVILITRWFLLRNECQMKAIVLIKISSLETRDAYCHMKCLEPVIESYMIYGRYDVVAIIEARNLEDIRRIIFSEIQPIPGVIETMPCLIVEEDNFSSV